MDEQNNRIAPIIPMTANEQPSSNGLFDDDTMALSMAKFSFVESMLILLTRDCSFSDFMHEMLLATMRAVKSEAGSILEVDYKNNHFFFRAVAGQSAEHLSDVVIPRGQGIVGHVAESRQAMVLSNLGENSVHLKAIQNAIGFEARCMIAVPIIVRGNVYGVLELLNRVGAATYDPNDVELINYICDMAARALELRMMLAWQKSEKGAA